MNTRRPASLDQSLARAIYRARREDALLFYDGDITANLGAAMVTRAVAKVLSARAAEFDSERFIAICETGAQGGKRVLPSQPTWGRNTNASGNWPPPLPGRCNAVVVKGSTTWNLRRPVRMPDTFGYCERKAVVGNYCRQHAALAEGGA